ncbi:dockerin [Paenibacillus kribbensis]|uniref:Dockerin n=1 Tax=Paenibacillus kribbensis TaxID=172713 RepID=A0A222WKU6_9BACL|nr:DUF6055 domain-containing protein [Paenibacillus kribbensis]ASR46391.1 dockerin [Paenibacillus kribbensis]
MKKKHVTRKTRKERALAAGVSALAMTLAFTGGLSLHTQSVSAQSEPEVEMVADSLSESRNVVEATYAVETAYAVQAAYSVRGVHNDAEVISKANANVYESEHFQFLWGNGGESKKVTKAFLEGNAKILEDNWDLFINKLKMTPPTRSTHEWIRDNKDYKVNVVILGTGLHLYEGGWAFAGLDSEGYPYLMCAPDAMSPRVQPGLPVPHEFGHVVQFAQGSNSWRGNDYLGPWSEAVGNWFREEYTSSDAYKQQSGTEGATDFSALYLRASTLTAVNGRAYYEAWPLLKYLEENPDGLPGYGSGFVAKLLQSGKPENPTESIYEVIQRINPQVKVQEMIGRFASRMATFDFSNQKLYKRNVENMLRYGELYWQQYYTMMLKVDGSENVYTIPSERAPQATGYNIIPLDAKIPANASSTTVRVKLDGLAKANGAGWQAYLIVENKNGKSRYSRSFGNGESVQEEVFNGEKAYLSVAATPTLESMQKTKIGIGSWQRKFSEKNIPFESKPQYPYQVTLENAEPQMRKVEESTGIRGHVHRNGGGFVADSARVDDSVYVAKNAKVLDSATVTGNVRIEDSAVVRGAARVSGSAKITDYALVRGSAQIGESATLSGYAIADGSAKITGHGHVGDQAVVTEQAEVSEYGQVVESALVKGYYTVSGHAVVKGLSIGHGGVSKREHGGATGQAVTYGDFFDDMGYTISGGSFAGYESLEASVKNFRDGYARSDGKGGYMR